MRISCWMPKARDAHSQYVIFFAFPLQQWLQIHACLNVTYYVHCLSSYYLDRLSFLSDKSVRYLYICDHGVSPNEI